MPAPYAIVDKQIKIFIFVDKMPGWQNALASFWYHWTEQVSEKGKIVVKLSPLENVEFFKFSIKLEGQKWCQDISLMTFSIMTLSLTTLSIALGTMDLIVTLSIMTQSISTLIISIDCHYVECQNAQCRVLFW